MQQVGAKAFAHAIAIDPASLPVLVPQARRRPGLGLGRIWVLHRRRVLQACAGLVLCAVGVAIYEVRGLIGEAGADLYVRGEAELAISPFGIKQISISGQAITSEKAILGALGIEPTTSMVNFDADGARSAIEALPAIEEATVRKAYPDHLFISVTERVPVARWRLNGTTYVIDATGAKLSEEGNDYPDLPLVIGEAAGDDAMGIITALNQFAALKKGLVALSRIGDRRWDMIYDTGARVQLPEQGVGQALAQLMTLEGKFQLLERDVTLIDLRVPGILAVRPSDQAAQQLAAIAKANIAKNKGSFKEDADYSAPGH